MKRPLCGLNPVLTELYFALLHETPIIGFHGGMAYEGTFLSAENCPGCTCQAVNTETGLYLQHTIECLCLCAK